MLLGALGLAAVVTEPAGAAGFQLVQVPQAHGAALPGAFWYPSVAAVRPVKVGWRN